MLITAVICLVVNGGSSVKDLSGLVNRFLMSVFVLFFFQSFYVDAINISNESAYRYLKSKKPFVARSFSNSTSYKSPKKRIVSKSDGFVSRWLGSVGDTFKALGSNFLGYAYWFVLR